MLHQNNQVIDITHKPLLLTNFKPTINIEDPAILRRLLVVPFLNIYKSAADIDLSNSHHRLMDPYLKDKLLSPEVLSQFLTWVVHGSVRWYQQGLGRKPGLMQEAEKSYIDENDHLGTFTANSCRANEEQMVETTIFREAFQTSTDSKISLPVLVAQMARRGFMTSRKRTSPGTNPKKVFQGIQIV